MESWTQEDQLHELKTDKCGWKIGGEPGEVGRGLTTQDLMGCKGEPWVGFQESELIRLAFLKNFLWLL